MLMAAEASGEASCTEPGDPLDDQGRGRMDEAASGDGGAVEDAGGELPVYGDVIRVQLGKPRTGADELSAALCPAGVMQGGEDLRDHVAGGIQWWGGHLGLRSCRGPGRVLWCARGAQ